ncbi:MAG: hypothetical protein JXB26_01400 [Candidatus Aminicenantes bacterium]|nr:hypothetical protein [Candidatus Aminicenantes bacterium]
MNKSQAIRKKCLECAGGSPKEVTLCPCINCTLWPYRFGHSMKDKRYEERMDKAKHKYPDEFQEVQRLISEQQNNG